MLLTVRRFCSAKQPLDPEMFWPDGTPKKFRGKESWKNWIAWDAPFRSQTDELNRQRHFFWEVDAKGALWRLELDQGSQRFGQMRHLRVVDDFLGHLQRNQTGLYPEFPFVSLRTHEHYFARWAPALENVCMPLPLVFNDLRDGELRHLVPGGGLAGKVTTPFDPASLRLTVDGHLLHPVWTTCRRPSDALKERCQDWALLDAATAQAIFECCTPADDSEESFILRWAATETKLLLLGDE